MFQPVLLLYECADPATAESAVAESAAEPLYYVADSATAKSVAEPL
jgi:hypothetical protein